MYGKIQGTKYSFRAAQPVIRSFTESRGGGHPGSVLGTIVVSKKK
jgi:hypothetical protein